MKELKIVHYIGYSGQIGILVSEMINARKDTIALVDSLNKDQLDFNVDKISNSIGTLLMHIAALEFAYQLRFFYKRDYTDDEFKKYEYALAGKMIHREISGNTLHFYLSELSSVRNFTLECLKEMDDKWLLSSVNSIKGYSFNNYYILRHLVDDEISHQGQIKWILKRFQI